MAGQPVGGVHIDAPLSNLAQLYRPLEAGFIADEICPALPVKHESDLYYKFTQGDFYGTDVSDLVPDKSPPREIEFSHSTGRYQAARRELAWTVSDRERGNADNQLNLERNKQVGTLGRLLLKKEIRVATILQDSGVTGGQLDSTMTAAKTAFWDGATTTYLQIATDVVKGRTAIRQAIGIAPNVIVIPAAVAEGLSKSKFYTDVQPFTRGSVDSQPLYEQYPLLPSFLWGMKVYVPGVIKNTAVEGQTASYSDIWGEAVRMLYVTPGPALEIPSVAYSFVSEPLTTRVARKDIERLNWYATGYTGDERVIAPFAGWTITDCLT